jgi:hypothetical protein
MEWRRSGDLRNTDLIVDCVYEGGRKGNAGDDPLNALLGVSNQGGFRILGKKDSPRLVVLTTSLADSDWPDNIDHALGQFTYYGDNRKPGHDLHGTHRYGNKLLKHLFDLAHGDIDSRMALPPIMAFASVGHYRDMRFLGLLVPGAEGVPPTDDLVAIWKSSNGLRFQNYRALFSVLDVAKLDRSWLRAVIDGSANGTGEPTPFREWKFKRSYHSLKADKSVTFRTKAEQLPRTENQCAIVRTIFQTFSSNPYGFELCAARLAEMMLPQVTSIDVTRPSRDGGRDAVGKFRLGGISNGIEVDFAMEAKCYAESNSVGVKELSRLISRLRHRQFGILVTTSHLATQAYQEIKDDAHPIVVVSGKDIAELLEERGLGNSSELSAWLAQFVR